MSECPAVTAAPRENLSGARNGSRVHGAAQYLDNGGGGQALHNARLYDVVVHDTLAAKTALELSSPRQYGAVNCACGCVERAKTHASAAPLSQAVSQGGLPVILIRVDEGELAMLRVSPSVTGETTV